MLIDNQLMFSTSNTTPDTGQVLAASGNSTNVIDLGASRNLGSGERLFVLLQFGTVVSNATLQTNLQGADDNGFTVNPLVIAASKTITPLSNTYFAFPIGPSLMKRFLRLVYTMAGGSSPSIPVVATIVRDVEMHLYLDGASALY